MKLLTPAGSEAQPTMMIHPELLEHQVALGPGDERPAEKGRLAIRPVQRFHRGRLGLLHSLSLHFSSMYVAAEE